MKQLLSVLACLLLCCTGCAALPAEEGAFAVALGVEGREGAWTVHARIPTYQSGGGYATITATGDTLPHALSALETSAPLQLHLGQLRVLIFDADTARSADFPLALTALSARHDLRPAAALAVTEEDLSRLMEALKPAAGTRLSKAIDLMLEARITQGQVLSAGVAAAALMGQRQQPVLMNAALEGDGVNFTGGWPLGADGRVREKLTPQETQLLALMMGEMTSGTLSLQEGVVRLTAATCEAELLLPSMQQTSVRLQLHCTASPLEEEALSRAVATACLGVLGRLSDMGCDALGLARQVIAHVGNMHEWQEKDWPARYREMDWAVSVGVTGATE